jgi:hypothetical protein
MKTTKFWTRTKNFGLSLFVACAIASTFAQDTRANSNETPPVNNSIINVIDYVRAIYPIDRGGFPYTMALVGGHAVTELPKPLYVTLRIGGQNYTALTDRNGFYSFMVYTNGAGRLTTEVWSDSGASSNISIHTLSVER